MRRHHEIAGLLPAAFHHVDLGRPAAVVGEHPERRPYANSDRYLCADFEIAVFLRKRALRGEDARDVFIVEQHRPQFGRRAACDDRENAILNLERIEPERRRRASRIARIDINLLLAVPGGLALEIGAVAAPIARFRPGGAAGVVRHPLSRRQGMLVEIVMERPMQRHRRERADIRRVDAAAYSSAGSRLTGRVIRTGVLSRSPPCGALWAKTGASVAKKITNMIFAVNSPTPGSQARSHHMLIFHEGVGQEVCAPHGCAVDPRQPDILLQPPRRTRFCFEACRPL